MNLLKRFLLAGWVLLFSSAFLVIEFPNAAWNRALSQVLWLLSIGVIFATVGLWVLVAMRLLSRMVRRSRPNRIGRISPRQVILKAAGLADWRSLVAPFSRWRYLSVHSWQSSNTR
jgi:hypothetical protein